MSDISARGGRSWIGPRTKIALGIAFIEGLIVAFAGDVSRWTVLVIAIPFIGLWAAWGRNSGRRAIREATWVLAASQALALVLVILAWILTALALILAVILAVLALIFLFADRPKR